MLDRYAHPTALPVDDPPAGLRRRLRRELAYFGDLSMLDPVVDGFLRLPPIVRIGLLGELAALGVGWDSQAWTSAADLIGPDGQRRARMILICGAEGDAGAVRRRTVHECAHAWRSEPCRPGINVTPLAIGEEGVLALAHEQDWPALTGLAKSERQATALGMAWECASVETGS